MCSDPFHYRNGTLFCEDADLVSLAEAHGTPAYVYSKNAIASRFEAYKSSFAGLPRAAIPPALVFRAWAKPPPKFALLSKRGFEASIANRNTRSKPFQKLPFR